MQHAAFRSVSFRHIITRLIVLSVIFSQGAFAQSDTSARTRLFRVIADQSVLRVLVGRAGMLARLGHNHVIVNRALSGEVILDGTPAQSSARIRIPVAQFIVDEQAERQLAGKGYESMPDEKARSDTYVNMLRPEVLDGQRWPEIIIETGFADADNDPPLFDITLAFRGKTVPLRLPAQLAVHDDRIEINASFSLNHAQLGLRPFAALGGALKVAEQLQFELLVTAVRITNDPPH